MAPGYIALEQALREMKAAAPGGHKYQLGHWLQRRFPLDQWRAETGLSFSQGARRTWPGVAQGAGFLVFWAGVGEEQSEGEKLTVTYRGLYLGNHDLSLFI